MTQTDWGVDFFWNCLPEWQRIGTRTRTREEASERHEFRNFDVRAQPLGAGGLCPVAGGRAGAGGRARVAAETPR